MARQMPIAKVVTVECGGHLMLGDHQATFTEAHAFLRAHSTLAAVCRRRGVALRPCLGRSEIGQHQVKEPTGSSGTRRNT
jgi:hypothetical protein